jgi:hypothetical protein
MGNTCSNGIRPNAVPQRPHPVHYSSRWCNKLLSSSMTTDTYFSFCVSTSANAPGEHDPTGEPIRCSLKKNYIDHRQQIDNIYIFLVWLFMDFC